jgi:atypical dual specificity phosphatase
VALADYYLLVVEKPVTVHCGAGKGRSGTFLAVFLVWRGMDPDEAVSEIRRLRPGSIETEAQLQSVHDFHQSLGRK